MWMSIISKKGKQAAESALAEKQTNNAQMTSFKSGTTLKVRIPSDEEYVEYSSVSVFKVINTVAVESGNLYEKASKLLYEDANKVKARGDEAVSEELRQQASQIKPKPRYLFGFFSLENGEPIVIDVSKKQAQVLIKSITKNARKLKKSAFEVSKEGSGQSTTVMITQLESDHEDESCELQPNEVKNFLATEGKEFPGNMYEAVLFTKDTADQADDLRAFGFDVSRLGVLGINDDVTPIHEEDLPF
jgi:hypothetical protein